MPNSTLRTRLESEAAGVVSAQSRGNALTGADVAASRGFADACWHLALASHRVSDGERMPAPPELLPPAF